MSYPPPPAYPQSPGAPFAGPPKHLRGRTPLRLSVIFLIVGIILAVVGGIIIAKKSLGAVNNFQRVSVADGGGTVTFSHTGNYLAYYEAPDVKSSITQVPVPAIAFKSPSGQVRVLKTLYGGKSVSNGHIGTKLTYSYGGHHGVAIYQFKITEKGKYQVEVEGANSGAAADSKIAFGKSIAGGIALGAGLLIPGILLIVVAIILLIIGLVKRSGHKKQLQQQPYAGAGFPPGGYPPPGGPQGGYPQPGSPQGGYPQPGGPQGGYPQPGPQPAPQPGPQSGGYPQPGYPQQPPPQSGGWSPPPSS